MAKTKLKTHRGAAKRLKMTGSGKVARSRAFGSHLLTKKTSKRKRAAKQGDLVHPTVEKTMKKLLPYL
ncbi:MAG: 50S ribosomal protein L35 [Nitrospirae bacterium]|nr:50S ribosomal protein L35 [Nitrospirota bacterium]